MPRPRADRSPRAPRAPRTAASTPNGSGCSSGLLLPPLAVLVVGCLLAAFVNFNDDAPYSVDAASPSDALSPIFTPEVQHWGNQILAWSADFGLDPNLAATVLQIESCGDPRALSRSGAMGLFQVMPFHFYSTDDPYHPDTNA
ncbi:MAG: transglycosylase SLT domain-containing protein, partial [Chloroflexota bacterium]